MKKALVSLLAFLFSITVLSFCRAGEEIVLTENGVTGYRILLPENPSSVQESAAHELAETLEKISGVPFSIERADAQCAEKADPNEKLLVIGPSAVSRKFLNGIQDESAIGYDGILIKQIGNSIVFSGHPVRGPLYAVDTFLEDELGCRWWTASESFIPKTEKITASDFDTFYVPDLLYRESFYVEMMGAAHGTFAARLKCNGNAESIPEELGGHHQYLCFVHSFYSYIKPTEYEAHPDWFPEIDGCRKVGYPEWARPGKEYMEMKSRLQPEQIHETGTQLCLTNEELFQTFLQRVLDDLEKHPEATIVSISQNDWHGYCTCEKCRKIAEEEGCESGVLLRFVNRMAEEIEKVRPDVWIDTLAYQYTRKPPQKTAARHNVIVRLCSIECSFTQTLDGRYGEPLSGDVLERRTVTDDQNDVFRSDIDGWRDHADHLFIWDYMTDFTLYLLPFPNYRVWQDNIRFYIDHHANGLFEQGDYHCPTGDFVQMRAWVVAKLLWNPNLSQRQLMEEYIAGYYAPELVPIYMAYFDRLSEAAEKAGFHFTIFRPTAKDWIDVETLAETTKLLDQALEIAERLEKENPELYSGLVYKVRRERIPLDLVRLMNDPEYRQEAADAGIELPGPDPSEMKALAEDFAARLDAGGVTRQAEWATPEQFKEFKDGFIKKYSEQTQDGE